MRATLLTPPSFMVMMWSSQSCSRAAHQTCRAQTLSTRRPAALRLWNKRFFARQILIKRGENVEATEVRERKPRSALGNQRSVSDRNLTSASSRRLPQASKASNSIHPTHSRTQVPSLLEFLSSNINNLTPQWTSFASPACRQSFHLLRCGEGQNSMAGHATSRVCIVPSQLPPHQAALATPPVDAFSAASPSVM